MSKSPVASMILALLIIMEAMNANGQTITEVLPDSVLKQQIESFKIDAVAEWHHEGGNSFLNSYHAFDLRGNMVMQLQAFGRFMNKYSFEYDEKGRRIKFVAYNNPDTSVVDYWITYQYNDVGTMVKSVMHSSKGPDQIESVTTVDTSGKYVNITDYNALNEKSVRRMYFDSVSRTLTVDIMDITQTGEIAKLATHYTVYDEYNRVVESGDVKYDDAFHAHVMTLGESAETMALEQLFYQMVLQGKLSGQKEPTSNYYYDGSGQLTSKSVYGQSVSIKYNAKKQVIERRSWSEENERIDGPDPKFVRITMYKYDGKGLLVREQSKEGGKQDDDIEYIYSYR